MEPVYDILQKVKNKPNVYLGSPSIMCLQAFLSGYNVAQYQLGESLNTPDCFDGFQEWIQEKLKINSSQSWAKIILFYSADERDALERFFELFDEFVKRNSSTATEEVKEKSVVGK
ncbi:MAG: hypothetical protein SXA11_09810 [Cyanobacteriota bacterium]|nr:hypothetical protein [Cyanobacteriota bacterium]